MNITIQKEACGGWSSTGFAFRAYRADGSPLYLGGETEAECRARVLDMYPTAVFPGIEQDETSTNAGATPGDSH